MQKLKEMYAKRTVPVAFLEKSLGTLESLSKEELIQDRYDKFREIGRYGE